jgi:hypothetical protein
VLAGPDFADLPAGAVAVVAATWTSLRLWPPGPGRIRLDRVRQEGHPPVARFAGDPRRMSLELDVLTVAAVSAVAFFFLAGMVGLLRFPDALTRVHALTKAYADRRAPERDPAPLDRACRPRARAGGIPVTA